ncbi:MAG: polyhydroxyalkanoic acid synthase [Betaproteobacteria bacterium]|nr:polyhydroxyalkanoic acid synthase [Betaproteobacteria bacterium]
MDESVSDTLIQPINSQNLDRMVHAWMGRLTQGLSPAALAVAYFDWAIHLAIYPGKRVELAEKGLRKLHRFIHYALHARDPDCPLCIEPLPQDERFTGPAWQESPFNLIHQSFLLYQQWWHNATTEVRGVSRHHEHVVNFASRQILDVFSPSNFILTNPEVLETTIRKGGVNLYEGAMNLWRDWERQAAGKPPEGAEAFRVGKNVAVTPGKVVFRNRLIELIQYSPATGTVYPEPVLVVPSWIMKYYILDLSPQNSLVKYLVDRGHTVFLVSWKNPGEADRDLGMDDYLRLGPMAALDALSAIVPDRRIHATGYCLGGTLLSVAASAMARDNDDRLKTVTLFAAEVDFGEPGELSLFIDDSQIAYLEDIMWDRGYLDGKQMAGAFQLLNSKDLIWSRLIHDYLMGVRRPLPDLMAWNADATRLPYRMHKEYLTSLYLANDLAEGRYLVNDRPIALSDIRAPIFAVGTVKDHVSPWKSVYKLHILTDTDVTFVLTTGGHNAGIVSEPGHPRRSYQIATRHDDEKYVDPETWQAIAPRHEGSWWPAWQQWLAERSGSRVAPPATGAPEKGYHPLGGAPGTYVLQP